MCETSEVKRACAQGRRSLETAEPSSEHADRVMTDTEAPQLPRARRAGVSAHWRGSQGCRQRTWQRLALHRSGVTTFETLGGFEHRALLPVKIMQKF